MKKLLWRISAAIMLLMATVGCPDIQNGSQTNADNSGKITSLQVVIDQASDGEVINLADYAGIADFDYNAVVNKTLTIQNGSNLGNATLQIAADGVALKDISGAKVSTNHGMGSGSLKISGSTLASLTLGGVESRSSDVNAQSVCAVISSSSVQEMRICGTDSQITIEDKTTAVTNITAETDCYVWLVDGTNDNITRPTVAAGSSLTKVNMKAGLSLQMLTIAQLPKTIYQFDETLDLSGLRILGTYVCNGVTVYTKDNWTVGVDTVSKIETDYELNAANGDILTESKTVTATVKDGQTEQTVPFDVFVAPKDATVKMTDFDIVLDETFRQTYTADVGKRLSLKGLTVNGKFTVGTEQMYRSVSYTAKPAEGMKVTKGLNSIAITVGGITKYIQLNVVDPIVITYYPNGADGDSYTKNVVADETDCLTECKFLSDDLTFVEWNTVANGKGTSYDETADIRLSSDLKLYAQWTNKYWRVSYIANADGVSGTMTKDNIDKTRQTFTLKKNALSKVGYSFQGWNTESDGSGTSYADEEELDISSWTKNVDLYAQWKVNRVNISVKIDVKYNDIDRPEIIAELYDIADLSGDYGTTVILPDFDDLSADLAEYICEKHQAVFNDIVWIRPNADESPVTFPAQDTEYYGMLYIDVPPDVLNIGIRYNNMEGASLNASGFDIAHELPFRLPSKPSKPGYDFAGWYGNEDLLGDPVTEVPVGIPDRTYVDYWAKWTVHPYTIKYYYKYDLTTAELTGDEISGLRTTFSVEDETFTIGNATKTGYDLTGWWTDSNFSGDPITQIVKGTSASTNSDEEAKVYKLYAKMEKAKYRLNFIKRTETDTNVQPVYYDIDGRLYDADKNSFGNSDNFLISTWNAGQQTGKIQLTNPDNDPYVSTCFEFDGFHLKADCSDASIDNGIDLKGLTGDKNIYYGWKYKTTVEPLRVNPSAGNEQVKLDFVKQVKGKVNISWTPKTGSGTAVTENDYYTVTGLSNNQKYTFTLTLTHTFAEGYSVTSSSITTEATPTAPVVENTKKGQTNALQTDPSVKMVVIIDKDQTAVINDTILDTIHEENNYNSYMYQTKQNVGIFTTGRQVTLHSYSIGQTEVTQSLYETIMESNPSHFSELGEMNIDESQTLRPVDSVSWYDAIKFCNKLTETENKSTAECVYYVDENCTEVYETGTTVYINLNKTGYRLPTEAEWEYAARGAEHDGTTWEYPFASNRGGLNLTASYNAILRYWPDEPKSECMAVAEDYTPAWCICDQYECTSFNITHQVATYFIDDKDSWELTIAGDDAEAPLYDMCGNVAEWCNDSYQEIEDKSNTNDHYIKSYKWGETGNCTDPLYYKDTTESGKDFAGTDSKVLRGGSCTQQQYYTSVYYRHYTNPEDSVSSIDEITYTNYDDEEITVPQSTVYHGFRLAKSIR